MSVEKAKPSLCKTYWILKGCQSFIKTESSFLRVLRKLKFIHESPIERLLLQFFCNSVYFVLGIGRGGQEDRSDAALAVLRARLDLRVWRRRRNLRKLYQEYFLEHKSWKSDSEPEPTDRKLLLLLCDLAVADVIVFLASSLRTCSSCFCFFCSCSISTDSMTWCNTVHVTPGERRMCANSS